MQKVLSQLHSDVCVSAGSASVITRARAVGRQAAHIHANTYDTHAYAVHIEDVTHTPSYPSQFCSGNTGHHANMRRPLGPPFFEPENH